MEFLWLVAIHPGTSSYLVELCWRFANSKIPKSFFKNLLEDDVMTFDYKWLRGIYRVKKSNRMTEIRDNPFRKPSQEFMLTMYIWEEEHPTFTQFGFLLEMFLLTWVP